MLIEEYVQDIDGMDVAKKDVLDFIQDIEQLRRILTEYKDLKLKVDILESYKTMFYKKEKEVAELKEELNNAKWTRDFNQSRGDYFEGIYEQTKDDVSDLTDIISDLSERVDYYEIDDFDFENAYAETKEEFNERYEREYNLD